MERNPQRDYLKTQTSLNNKTRNVFDSWSFSYTLWHFLTCNCRMLWRCCRQHIAFILS